MTLPATFLLGFICVYLVGRRRAPRRPSLARELELLGAFAAIAVALGPLDLLAHELFAAHMAQHLLLLMVAPALLALARPWPILRRALPVGTRRRVAAAIARVPVRLAGALASPLAAFAIWTATMAVWHLPVLYDAALASAPVHAFQHMTFLGSGVLYFSTLVGATARRRAGPARRAAWATAGLLSGWVLAIVVAGAGEPLYERYASATERPFGLSALADQGIAAGIMWVPGSIPLTVVVLVCISQLLSGAGRGAVRPARVRVRPEGTSA